MRRKVLMVHGNNTLELEEMLNQGWIIEHMAPYIQSISKAGTMGVVYGNYGMYVILKKQKKKEVEAILAMKGIEPWD